MSEELLNLKISETIIFAKIDSHKNINYKNRLTVFYKKNGLSSRHKLLFYENGEKTTIIASAPNIRVANKVTRIIKLIAHYKKQHLELLTVPCPIGIIEIWRLMQNA